VFGGGLKANGDFHAAPANGCFYSMDSDSSYYWFHLQWNDLLSLHSSIALYKDTEYVSDVPLDSESTSKEHLCTRFASHGSEFVVTITGDQCLTNYGQNCSEIELGKLDRQAAYFKNWVQFTNDTISDYAPDAWVGVDEDAPMSLQGLVQLDRYPPGATPETAGLYINFPVPGDTFSLTDSINLSWAVSNSSQCVGWMMSFSVDQGLTWRTINSDGALPVTTRSYRFAAGLLAQDCTDTICRYILLKVNDYSNNACADIVGPIIVLPQ
jgi:hypothetical protein